METICLLPAEVPESRILYPGCQERVKGSGERVSHLPFHPATGDLYLIPSVAPNRLSTLCLRQLLLPSIHPLKFLSGFYATFLLPGSTSIITTSSRLRFPSCFLCFQFSCLLLLLPAAPELAVAFHGVIFSDRAASRNR